MGVSVSTVFSKSQVFAFFISFEYHNGIMLLYFLTTKEETGENVKENY